MWGLRSILWADMFLDLFMGRKEGRSEMLCIVYLDIMKRDGNNEDWAQEQSLLLSQT